MKRREHHHHHYHHHSSTCPPKPIGTIKRTIRALADKFNVPRGMVIFAFVILFIMSVPLAIVTFLGAAYWVKHPGKVEDGIDSFVEKTRRTFSNFSESSEFGDAQPAGAGTGGAHAEDDFDFSELKRKFDDLEERTGGMEEHVSSDEFQLNKDLDDIK